MDFLDGINPGDWVNNDFQLSGTKKVKPDGMPMWFVYLEGLSCAVDNS